MKLLCRLPGRCRPKLAQLKAERKYEENIFPLSGWIIQKRLPERFLAYEALLKETTRSIGKIRYTQIAPTSRGEVRRHIRIFTPPSRDGSKAGLMGNMDESGLDAALLSESAFSTVNC